MELLPEAQAALKSAELPDIGASLRKIRAQGAVALFNQALAFSARSGGRDHAHLALDACYGRARCYAIIIAAIPPADVLLSPVLLRELAHAISSWVANRHSEGKDDVATCISSVLSLSESWGLDLASRQRLYATLSAALCRGDTHPSLARDVLFIRLSVAAAYQDTVLLQAVDLFDKQRDPLKARSILTAEDSSMATLVEKVVDCDHVRPKAFSPSTSYTPATLLLIRDEREIYLAGIEAHQYLAAGDVNWAKTLTEEAENVHLWAQLAQDDYRAAYHAIVGKDIEVEGVCLCRLARYHAKITKLGHLAHELYLAAVQLGAALAPAQPSGSWFHDAAAAVQARRDKLEAQENQLWHNKLSLYSLSSEDYRSSYL